MKRYKWLPVVAIGWGLGGLCAFGVQSTRAYHHRVPTLCVVSQTDGAVPAAAQRVMDAYPAFRMTYRDNALHFEDGTKIIYDDGREKSFEEKLDDCDIEDMFSMDYDRTSTVPGYLEDCGRGRNEELF